MVWDIVWVLGLRREKFSTTIWLVAMRVVTDITKIRYLRKTKRRSVLERRLKLYGLKKINPSRGQQRTHTDSLANERDRKRCLRDLLSNKKEEDSLSQQDRDGHSQLLSPGCEGDNRDLWDRRTTPNQNKNVYQLWDPILSVHSLCSGTLFAANNAT